MIRWRSLFVEDPSSCERLMYAADW